MQNRVRAWCTWRGALLPEVARAPLRALRDACALCTPNGPRFAPLLVRKRMRIADDSPPQPVFLREYKTRTLRELPFRPSGLGRRAAGLIPPLLIPQTQSTRTAAAPFLHIRMEECLETMTRHHWRHTPVSSTRQGLHPGWRALPFNSHEQHTSKSPHKRVSV